MDIFTFQHVPADNTYGNGKIVNGLRSKLWVERYDTPGEFKLVGQPTTPLREQLAIGTLLSHTNTGQVMIVEDHEIIDDTENGSEFIVTGRSLDSFLEHRPSTDDDMGFDPYPLYDGTAWPVGHQFGETTPPELLVKLISAMLVAPEDDMGRPEFAIPDLNVAHTITATYTPKIQDVQRGELASEVYRILDEIGAGIRVERPNQAHDNMKMVIHKGVNRRKSVRLSWDHGDIVKARYFWSQRGHRNATYISNNYQGLYVRLGSAEGETGLHLGVSYEDATDLRQAQSFAEVLKIYSIMETRAKRLLRRRKHRAIMEATVASTGRYRYRKHYNVGDIIFVDGNYGVSGTFRVTEFAETDDENGQFGHPTLESVKIIDPDDDDPNAVDIYETEVARELGPSEEDVPG